MNLLQRIKSQFTIKKLQYRWRQIKNALLDTKTLWSDGLADEIAHWENVFNDPQQAASVLPRADKTRPLVDHITEKLAIPDNSTLRILDIGSGPITLLGYVWGNRKIEIVPIDPLAHEYNRILEKVNCQPPFKTQFGHAETIAEQFPAASFDIVYSNNALDHSYDPMSAIRQAMTILKPNGTIVLRHRRNEGKRVYNGLHQWNFDVQNGEFVVWNMKKRYVVSQELANVKIDAKVNILANNWQSVDVYIHKLV